MIGKIALIVAVGAGGRDGIAVNAIGKAVGMCRGVRGHDGFVGGNRISYGSCAILVLEVIVQRHRSILIPKYNRCVQVVRKIDRPYSKRSRETVLVKPKRIAAPNRREGEWNTSFYGYPGNERVVAGISGAV